MSVDVRKTIADAGYIAVGIGVLSYQQAQSRGRELQERLAGTSGAFNEQAKEVRERVKTGLDEAGVRAKQFSNDLRSRVEPFVEQIEGRLDTLPDPISRAAEPVARAVKTLVGSAA